METPELTQLDQQHQLALLQTDSVVAASADSLVGDSAAASVPADSIAEGAAAVVDTVAKSKNLVEKVGSRVGETARNLVGAKPAGAKSGSDGAGAEGAADPAAGIGDAADNVGQTIDKFTDIINLGNVLTVLSVFFFTWLLIKLLNWFFDWSTERFNQHRLRILRVQPIVFVLVWTVMLYALIQTLFHPTSDTIFALGASSALALGFAAQDILKNIFGGLLILFDRPFQIGDRINVKGNYGEVTAIGLRTTRIQTLDDSTVTIPNAMVMNDGISNANSGALDCMVVVNLWLPIGVNVEYVRKIAYEAAITSRYLNIDKPVVILFFDHFDNEPATNVKVKAYVLDARYEKAFEGDVTEAAKKGFREAGIYEKVS